MNTIIKTLHQTWIVLSLSAKRFWQIDGDQRSGAFAYYAFSSLFPLIILFVTVVSAFINSDMASRAVINYIENYVPLGDEIKNQIFNTIAGVIRSRGKAGTIASLILIWGSIQFFITLIYATNRAWDVKMPAWWRLPLKSIVMLLIMISLVLVGITIPIVARMATDWLFPVHGFIARIYGFGSFIIPMLVLFLGISLFYKLAPRRQTKFSEVWLAAIAVTICIRLGESVFIIYLKNFATLNAIYGTFGGVMALLLWIYFSGIVFIFGACLCASQTELHKTQTP
jgi:Ca2+-transporting ATPase